MTENTDSPAPTVPEIAGMKLSEIGSAHAPFLYFDEAPAFGCLNGVVRITLEAIRTVPSGQGSGIVNDRVIAAHLRMTIHAALSLKAAIDGALLLAAQSGSEAQN